MSLQLIEGFDYYNSLSFASLRGWSQSTGGITSVGWSGGRFGGLCYNSTGDGFSALTKSVTGGTTLVLGAAIFVSSTGTTGEMLTLKSGSTQVCRLQVQSTGNPLRVLNSGSTVIATGTTPINSNTWCYVEVKCFVNTGTPANGSVAVQLNGVSEIAPTTGNFGSSSMNAITIGPQVNFVHGAVDDVYVLDTTGTTNNNFLGDVRVTTHYPNADGTHSQWSPTGGGSHFSQVNEHPPDGDTTYVSDANPGDIDTYAFDDVDGGATVFGVQANLYARKDDANTRQIAPVVRQAGTDYVGTTATLGSGYAYYSQLYDTDPTGSAWTATNFNADEFGVKEIA